MGLGDTPREEVFMDKEVIVDPQICRPPKQWVCDPHSQLISCQCEQVYTQYPGRQCTASVVFGEFTPYNPVLVPMEPHCTAAGVEVALAVMLARCMSVLSCGLP